MTIRSDLSVQALSETVKALRLARGESQTLAAQRIGVSRRSWQRMESSDANVAGQVAMGDFMAGLEVYGVSVLDLLSPVALAAANEASPRRRGRTPRPLHEPAAH